MGDFPHAFLSRHPVLGRLDANRRDALQQRFREMQLPARRSVFHEGSAAAGLHVVVSGWIRMTRSSAGGQELILALVGPGEFLGPCCNPFTKSEVPCGAWTQTAVHLLSLSAADWSQLWNTDPLTARVISAELLASRKSCVNLGIQLALLPVEKRLAHLLNTLTRASAGSERRRTVSLILSHAQMAAAIGSSREVVTRLLKRFEASGWIGRKGREITVIGDSLARSFEV